VCTGCGLVIGRARLEVCTFEQSQAMSPVAFDEQCGSAFAPRRGLARVQQVANKESLSKSQSRQRNLRKKLGKICDRMEINQGQRERARFVMFRILNCDELRRVKKDELLAAVSLMVVFREQGVERLFEEIASNCENVRKKEICSTYKTYERVICKGKGALFRVNCSDCRALVPRFCSMLGLDFKHEKRIRKFYKTINGLPACSTLNPLTRLAVALNLSVEEVREHLEAISIVSNVSQHTIQKSTELVKAEFNANGKQNIIKYSYTSASFSSSSPSSSSTST